MASKTNYLQAELINAVVRNIAYATPATVYVGLFTVAPTDAYTAGVPTGTQVAGNAYVRQAIAFGAPGGAPETATNSGTISFPAATPGAWGTVTHFGIFDAVGAGGNLLYWASLTAPKAVGAGDIFQFAVAAISLTEN